MERLSIVSFLQNGHDYHLYVYDDLPNVPERTIIKDANEILPASRIFKYTHRPSYAGFANHFRYRLLFQRGGWWADTDVVCLRPFDFPDEYVFASELAYGKPIANNGVMKTPAGSELVEYAAGVCETKDPQQLVWGETGPRLLTELIVKFDLNQFQKPYSVFCPITNWHKVLEPYIAAVPPEAYAIHLWNSFWHFAPQDKNADYHPACIYEQLKRKYLYSTSAKANSPGSEVTAEIATSR
ncbi:MAG TPA: glycosyltransferase [Pyrinomonadaceae bacterium]|nr:glycosyltransferase [Pyrinomonadaceae bacterium]